jgi:hypothetical protein
MTLSFRYVVQKVIMKELQNFFKQEMELRLHERLSGLCFLYKATKTKGDTEAHLPAVLS